MAAVTGRQPDRRRIAKHRKLRAQAMNFQTVNQLSHIRDFKRELDAEAAHRDIGSKSAYLRRRFVDVKQAMS
jgi:hypothetical protein